MLKWALIFVIIAAVLALFGFGGAAGLFASGAEILFIGFIVLVIAGAAVGVAREVAS